jgi:hypothetical protein
VRAVAGQFHLAGDLFAGGLDRLRHSAMTSGKMVGMLAPWPSVGGTSTAVPRVAWAAANAACRPRRHLHDQADMPVMKPT